MKMLLVLCFVSMAVAAQRWTATSNPADIEHYGYMLGSSNYRLFYEQSDGTNFIQEGKFRNKGRIDEHSVIDGCLSWVGSDGLKYFITYRVDKDFKTLDEYDDPEGDAPGAGDAGTALATILGR